MNSGSLIDLINLNQDYNFTVTLDMPQTCDAPQTGEPIQAGTVPFETRTEPLVKYFFNRAKLDQFSY